MLVRDPLTHSAQSIGARLVTLHDDLCRVTILTFEILALEIDVFAVHDIEFRCIVDLVCEENGVSVDTLRGAIGLPHVKEPSGGPVVRQEA